MMINNMPAIDLHLSRLGSTLTPLKKALSIINSTASQFIEQMLTPNGFYTYAYLREDRTPYYIGKGQGRRISNRQKKDIKAPKDKSRIIYLKQNLTEEEAFKHEIYMIDVFGRKDLGTGILRNRTNGGEGSSGCIPSQETRRKRSEAMSGENHYNYGKNPSEETRKRMSDAHKGENNHNYGKTLSEEHKIKIGKGNKNKIFSEEHRRKMSESRKKRITSKETRKRMSDAHKNPSGETRRKIGDASKGTKWWNDGCGNCKRMIECPGDGWRLGRK